MSMKVKINIDSAQKILLKRGLNQGGAVQRKFTHEVRDKADKYVPYRTDTLKNTAIEKVDKIEYIQPYAQYLWYGKKMAGNPLKVTDTDLNFYGAPMRGRFWVLRMWADRGNDIVKTMEKFVGGKPE